MAAITKQSGPHANWGECQYGSKFECRVREELTAVMVSMQSTNGSEVRYLESEKAYSFHS